MQTMTIRAGETSQPYALGVGSAAQIYPGGPNVRASGTGYFEYSASNPQQVIDGTAVWATWPRGSQSVSCTAIALYPIFARLVCTAGYVTGVWGDTDGSTSVPNALWDTNLCAVPFDTSGNYIGPVPVGQIYGGGAMPLTWALKPNPATYPGALFRFTDVGGNSAGVGGGNFFYSDGTRYKAVNGEALLDSVDTANAGIASASEQQLNPNHIIIPAGVIGGNDRFDITCGVSKSGVTDSMIVRLRFGAAGTVADTAIATVNIQAASLSAGFALKAKRISATTIQIQGSANTLLSYGSESATAYATAVTVSNMDSTALYMSVTAQMSGTTDIPTLQDYTLKISSTDSA